MIESLKERGILRRNAPHLVRPLRCVMPLRGRLAAAAVRAVFLAHRCLAREVTPVPIGRELAGVRACVLDPEQRPLPAGLVGELALGGPTLFRGYLGRDELTRAA